MFSISIARGNDMHNRWVTLRNECILLANNGAVRFLLRMSFLLTILFLYGHAHAEGKDIAEGAAEDIQATEKGTGLKILYAVEFFVGLVGFIMKRSLVSLVYIFVIALFVGYVGNKYLV
jgi:hypothetical protein